MVSKKELVDRIFMVIFGLLGAFLFGMSNYSFSVMNDNCTTPVIYDGVLVIMILGAVLFTIAVSYLFCVWKGGRCYNPNDPSSSLSEIYIFGSSIITFVLLVILSAVLGKLYKEPSCTGNNGVIDENGKQLRFNLWLMFGICLVAFLASIGGNYYINYIIPSHTKGLIKKPEKKVEKEDDDISDRYYDYRSSSRGRWNR